MSPMGGPARRGTTHRNGQDPIDVEENQPEVNLSYHRVYSFVARAEMPLEASVGTPARRHLTARANLDLKGGAEEDA